MNEHDFNEHMRYVNANLDRIAKALETMPLPEILEVLQKMEEHLHGLAVKK